MNLSATMKEERPASEESFKESAIKISNLRKVFERKGEEVEAIKGINLDIKEGEFVSVVGPSGCGKSTFLHIVGGFIEQTSGTINVRGEEVGKPAPDRGMMFQESTLFPWRKVYDNVAWGLEVQKFPKDEIQRRVKYFLKLVGLWEFKNNLPSELSGGMRQRVSLARVLAFEPKVLLMDEPFGALDSQTRETMQVELRRIWSESKKSVIFVTHDIEEAVYLSDYVVVLTKRPAVVKEIVEIDLPRRRDVSIRKSYEFIDYRNHIWDLLHEEENVKSIGGRYNAK
ncbi:ABC transporter ATP-binding protein [Sporosarcina pasteurii]|uniref:Bicarbonate transport ATP-binding protein CmpD n=1 Tax=Sporosarcina pasteurii TaxID=1474 RepID=A0A380C2D0_SPOPA|nr:ABC transporter ATP-binding protein [Sporosarcina pasteurii]MDS9471628.1 ABC transporter ATP-binding protein [Sporosarcina pasteurii]SUJ11473.1 Bicarbonate transport ATP-binding protein CmpD [Sporosarcina pasteurii]